MYQSFQKKKWLLSVEFLFCCLNIDTLELPISITHKADMSSRKDEAEAHMPNSRSVV